MNVDIRRADDVAIVDLSGKLAAGGGDRVLRDTLGSLLEQGWRKILLNLSEVTYMDSAGVGELVAGLRQARSVGAGLKLLNANERVHSTLYISRLLPVFEIYRAEGEAVSRFQDGGR